jgi:hypothetical protein
MATAKVLNLREASSKEQPVEPTCPHCGGLGFVKVYPNSPTNQHLNTVERCNVCDIPSRIQWLLDHCGLVDEEIDYRLDGWQPGNWDDKDRRQQRIRAMNRMRQAIDQRTGLYTFWGDFGAGKSYALAIVCNELRAKLVETYYTSFVQILDHLRSLFAARKDSSYYWERLGTVPVLAIDEVTRFDDTKGWAREKLFALVEERYRHRKSQLTMFSTNDNPNNPVATEDDLGYLFSRMREGQVIELRGDFRKIAGNAGEIAGATGAA